MFYFENHTADSTAATGQILLSSIIADNLSLSTSVKLFYVTSEVKQLQAFSLGKALAGVSVDAAMRLFWRYVEMAPARGYSWNIWTRAAGEQSQVRGRTIKMSSAATLRTKSLTSRHKSGFQTNQIFKMSNFHDIQIVVEIFIFFFDYFSFFFIHPGQSRGPTDRTRRPWLKGFPCPKQNPTFFQVISGSGVSAQTSKLDDADGRQHGRRFYPPASLLRRRWRARRRRRRSKKKSPCNWLDPPALLFKIYCQPLHSSFRDPVSWRKCVLSVTCLTLISPVRNVPIL